MIALVTGAARGIGRGVALELGTLGATVYLTDRESHSQRHSELAGTVEDTADQVGQRGGRGIPAVIDHRTGDDQVAELLARIDADHGGLDLLVSNAAAGNELPFGPAPFWELDHAHWGNMFDVGVRSHLVAASHAAPLLAKSKGLLVLTGYDDGGDDVLGGHAYYDLAMRATSRLAVSMARDLGPKGATALCLSPGFTATEAIVAAMGGRAPGSDSVALPGLAVAALAQDPKVDRHAGQTLTVADLARAYGLADPDPAPSQ